MRIAVVGAGIIGLAIAVELDRRGHDVTAFDPDPANGASRAAAGMLAAVTETDWAQDALHPLLHAAAAEYPAFVSTLERESGQSLGYRATAALSVGVDAADRESLVRLSDLQCRDGAHVERLTGSRARDLEPALGPAVSSTMRMANDHQIDPRRITAALRHLLGEKLRHEKVTAVLDESATPGVGAAGRSILLESGEQIDADLVIVAAGLGSAMITGVTPMPVRPVWGDILRLRVPEALRPLLTHTVRALVHGRAVYLVPRDDGSLVLGASVREGGVAGVQAGGVLALLRDAQQVLPGIEECEITEMLARPRPASPDAAPILGFTDPGLLIANGFDRHGVLFAPLAARLGADLAEGRKIDALFALSLSPARFAPATMPHKTEQQTLTPPAVTVPAGTGMKG